MNIAKLKTHRSIKKSSEHKMKVGSRVTATSQAGEREKHRSSHDFGPYQGLSVVNFVQCHVARSTVASV